MKQTIAIMCVSCLMMLVGACAQESRLENGYFSINATGDKLTSMRVDPSGQGNYGENWLIDMAFDGVAPGGEIDHIAGDSSLRITGLEAQMRADVEIGKGHTPDQLNQVRTLGQSFEVKVGTFDRVRAHTPTWNTSDSGATLSLRRDGPEGEQVAQSKLANIKDNSWSELAFAPQPPGRYYVELSDVVGTVGWWSSHEGAYEEGQGHVDGKPVPNVDRDLQVDVTVPVGTAEALIGLDGPRMTVRSEVRLFEGRQAPTRELVMKVRWDNEGYEVSSETVPFFRFFADNMRYMPTQQLKRWTQRDGWYEHGFSGAKWIEAEGTDGHDLRLDGRALGLRWHLMGRETTLNLSTGPSSQDGAAVNEVVISALPREDSIPDNWPQFVLPDADQSREANTFFYERGFSYPPVWGPAPWMEWNLLARTWQAGSHINALRNYLQTYPMTDEGYVNTWGGGQGWPFPDPSKYDTRHFDTNARFIMGCWRFACWTGDMEFLRGQATRLRKAMEYQLGVLKGSEGLIVTDSKDVNGRHEGVGNNYWDILPFGNLDAFANAIWYASLESMAQIEQMLAGTQVPQSAPPGREPGYYRQLAERTRQLYNETFWDEDKGRYIGCVDIDGKRHDYGFTFVNLEAMAYGLASDEQARRIYQWMEEGKSSSGEADIYSRWLFAPRATTIHNPPWNPKEGKLSDVPQEPWWHFGWRGTPFDDQCQDGGAILYTSYFDLMARCRHLGSTNAWGRWSEILDRWRMPDHLCGGTPLSRGEHPQQIDAGSVGLDIPFPESGMVPCWLLYGALGIDVTSAGMVIAPDLPDGLPRLEIRNVAYHGLPLNIGSDGEQVTVSCDHPDHTFTWSEKLGDGGSVTFTQPPAPVRFPDKPVWETASTGWSAKWIWADDPEAELVFIRHSIDLPDSPMAAWLTITGDNAFTLYVNGQKVATGSDWSLTQTVDLTKCLRKGTNLIAVRGENPGGVGGLVAQGACRIANAKPVKIATSSRWRISVEEQAGWMATDFDDSGWGEATPYGSPPCGPWGDIGAPGGL